MGRGTNHALAVSTLTMRADLRYAIRMLWKNPGFTAVAVLILAFGAGATTAIFSVVNATLFRPLPYKDAGRLVFLWSTRPGEGLRQVRVSGPAVDDWRLQNHVFTGMAAFLNQDFNLTGSGTPERILGQ